MKLTDIKTGKWYETKYGTGVVEYVGGRGKLANVRVRIMRPMPLGMRNIAPREVLNEVEAPVPQLKGGKKWTKNDSKNIEGWDSDCGDFRIMQTREGKFRLVAFAHEPSSQFPQAEFWMREYDSLHAAQHQAEAM